MQEDVLTFKAITYYKITDEMCVIKQYSLSKLNMQITSTGSEKLQQDEKLACV